jgi:hypothetical protein
MNKIRMLLSAQLSVKQLYNTKELIMKITQLTAKYDFL